MKILPYQTLSAVAACVATLFLTVAASTPTAPTALVAARA